MIVQTEPQEGLKVMTSFRSRLRKLMLEHSVTLGHQLTQTELANESGVSWATIQRWQNPEYTFNRVDAETLYGLMHYFSCTFEDLIEEVRE